ncbi:MAG: lysylphosphatidylglycerol synthase transmembrane domain-containing protein [Candidatus Saccharimonadales bacterium]
MKFKNIFLIIGLIGLVIVIILNIRQLSNFIHLLSTVNILVVFLIVVVQLFSYFLNAMYYNSILILFSHRGIRLYRLFEGAMAANFINYIIPSAGVAGVGLFSQVLYPEVPRGKGVLVQIMRYALSALAVLVMLPIGISLIVLTRPENKNIDRIAITASLAILAGAICVVAVVHQEKWLRSFIKRSERNFKRIFKRLKTGAVDEFVNEFFIGYHAMVKQKRGMLIPFGWSLIYIVVEILTLYLAVVAFGKFINPGVVIMAYLIANITSFIGGSLFSVGVFELGMLGTFVALGQPFVLALSITIVYRVVNLIVGLPPGFIFYRRILKS